MPIPALKLFAEHRSNILNVIFFQCGWFICLLGGDAVAMMATAIILILHWLLISRSSSEWMFVGLVSLLGLLIDSLLSFFGVFFFSHSSLGFIPVWLFCIWVLFATTLSHSLGWLKQRLWLAALLGACSGPMAYLAGSELASVTLMQPQINALLLLAVIWSGLLPGLFLLMRSLPWFALRVQ